MLIPPPLFYLQIIFLDSGLYARYFFAILSKNSYNYIQKGTQKRGRRFGKRSDRGCKAVGAAV